MTGFLAVYGEYLGRWLPPLLRAAVVTLELAILTIAVGLVLGLAVALLKISRLPLLCSAASAYIEVIRGTPALTQIYIVYFGLAGIGIRLDNFMAAVTALGINTAAYMAEIYRAGIESVHKGQREAALSLGMTPAKAMRHVVLPQAWSVVLPPGANLAIAILKDTSLASAIATPELMSRAYDLVGQSWRPMHIYLLAALLYAAMCLPLGRLVRHLEHPARRGDLERPQGTRRWAGLRRRSPASAARGRDHEKPETAAGRPA
jgi:His/Glu/Gln/Arg/opine family amino acid ABC transporter permease subunit